MQNYQSFGELKATARKSLGGNYGRAIFMLINVEIFSFLPSYISMLLFSGNSVFHIIGSEIVNFIMTAFLQVLQIGVCLFYLKLHCNQQASTLDLFHGFRVNHNQALGIGLVFSVISYICNLPAMVISYRVELLDIRLFYLLLLGGILITFLVLTPLRQSYYILLDFPNLSAKQAMLFSIRIMKGNCVRYILLTMSFFPLILLSFLCCGIGLLWVLPYMESSITAFYLDLIKKYQTNQST